MYFKSKICQKVLFNPQLSKYFNVNKQLHTNRTIQQLIYLTSAYKYLTICKNIANKQTMASKSFNRMLFQ